MKTLVLMVAAVMATVVAGLGAPNDVDAHYPGGILLSGTTNVYTDSGTLLRNGTNVAYPVINAAAAPYNASTIGSATAAIQAALNAASNKQAVVFLPAGVYSAHGLRIPFGVTLQGEAGTFTTKGTTIYSSSAGALVTVDTGSVTFKDLEFQADAFSEGGIGIACSDKAAQQTANVKIDNVRFRSLYQGLMLTNSWVWDISSCYFTSCSNGIYAGPNVNSIRLYGGEMASCVRGIACDGASCYVWDIASTFESCGIGVCVTNTCTAWSIHNSYFEANTNHVWLNDSYKMTIRDSSFIGGTAPILTNITLINCTQPTIADNRFTDDKPAWHISSSTSGPILRGNNLRAGRTALEVNLGSVSILENPENGSITAAQTGYNGYTVANLPSAGVGPGFQTYCTDCLTPVGTGDRVEWNGSSWTTLRNRIVATTDVPTYILSCASNGVNLVSPISSIEVATEAASIGAAAFLQMASTQTGTGALGYYNDTITGGTRYRLDTGTTTTGTAAMRAWFLEAIVSGSYYACGAGAAISAQADGTETFWAMFGIEPLTGGAIPTTGAFFLYDRYNVTGHGQLYTNNWICVTARSSSYTYADSGLQVRVSSTAWDRLGVMMTSTSAAFYTNGVLATTLNTAGTIPNTAIYLNRSIATKSAGTTSRTLYIYNPWAHVRRASARIY